MKSFLVIVGFILLTPSVSFSSQGFAVLSGSCGAENTGKHYRGGYITIDGSQNSTGTSKIGIFTNTNYMEGISSTRLPSVAHFEGDLTGGGNWVVYVVAENANWNLDIWQYGTSNPCGNIEVPDELTYNGYMALAGILCAFLIAYAINQAYLG